MLESQSSLTEEIVYSNILKKINKRGAEQERIILITSRAVYNLLPKNPGKCKRRIPIEDIGAVTLSSVSEEFVLHVPNEYDYRFKSLEKETIAKVLKQVFKARSQKESRVYGAVSVFPVQRIKEKTLKHVTHTKGTSQKLSATIFDTTSVDDKKEREKENDYAKPVLIVTDSESAHVERGSSFDFLRKSSQPNDSVSFN